MTVGLGIFNNVSRSIDLITFLLKAVGGTIIYILFLRNLFVSRESSFPNPPLWFIPFIFSFYLVFPWLYKQIAYRTAKACTLVLLVALAVEFIYRAISIYWLDSIPIGYKYDFLKALPKSNLPVTIQQLPFGLFPSRMAEFILGMIGAIVLVKIPEEFNNIFNFWVGVAGVFI